jgi:hypothetical protein
MSIADKKKEILIRLEEEEGESFYDACKSTRVILNNARSWTIDDPEFDKALRKIFSFEEILVQNSLYRKNAPAGYPVYWWLLFGENKTNLGSNNFPARDPSKDKETKADRNENYKNYMKKMIDKCIDNSHVDADLDIYEIDEYYTDEHED